MRLHIVVLFYVSLLLCTRTRGGKKGIASHFVAEAFIGTVFVRHTYYSLSLLLFLLFLLLSQ